MGYAGVVALLTILWAISLVDPIEDVVYEQRWVAYVMLLLSVLLTGGVAWHLSNHAATPVNQLERVRSDFVANASHELKTPVAGIRLLAESISRASAEGDTKAVAEFAERLDHESARLQRLTSDLMDLSRLEDEERPSRGEEYCELDGIVATVVESHQAKAQKKGITLVFFDETPVERGCRVRMSSADAALVVNNLLVNALAYTEEGGVTVTLAMQGERARLTVADTGIGIPVSDQERVFERFYRVDTARSRELGGTGLGLSIVRHAVDRANGSIALSSVVGEGSTFTVCLPLAQGP
jgi:two-component system sensor histidine kinase SenX3